MIEFMTVTEFANALKVTRQTVVNWITDKKIKCAVMPNGHYRIPTDELKKIMEVK